ncbi:hypothetical protein HOY82DRAFT_403692 [Tuber indicum]|nr:hypothetical protein HOY82DRAFT_403692 [Tuber indicum]
MRLDYFSSCLAQTSLVIFCSGSAVVMENFSFDKQDAPNWRQQRYWPGRAISRSLSLVWSPILISPLPLNCVVTLIPS